MHTNPPRKFLLGARRADTANNRFRSFAADFGDDMGKGVSSVMKVGGW